MGMGFVRPSWKNSDGLAMFIVYGGLGLAIAVAAIAIFMGVTWLLWVCWLAVGPLIWFGGPYVLTQPTYWNFLAAWVLLTTIIGLFKRKGK